VVYNIGESKTDHHIWSKRSKYYYYITVYCWSYM